MKGKFFVALRKVNETGNDNLFVAQHDIVEVHELKDNTVVFDFSAKCINHTGQPMNMDQSEFNSNFQEYIRK